MGGTTDAERLFERIRNVENERSASRDEFRRRLVQLRTRLDELIVRINEYARETSRAKDKVSLNIDRLDLAAANNDHVRTREKRSVSDLRRDYLNALRTEVKLETNVKRCT